MANRFSLVKAGILNRQFYQTSIKKVIATFREAVAGLDDPDCWRIEDDVQLRYRNRSICPVDIVVLKDDQPVVLVLIKRQGFIIRWKFASEIERLRVYRRYYGAAAIIVCDDEAILNIEINDRTPKNYRHQPPLTKENIIAILCEQNVRNTPPSVEFSADIVKEAWRNVLNNPLYNAIPELDKLKAFVEGLDDDSFSLDGNIFCLTRAKEEELIKTLLGTPQKGETIVRFSSIESLLRTCNNATQSMCSIVCMNDKSEVDYTSKQTWTLQGHPFPIEASYQCFILSCCSSETKDNLTMKRLYADNNRGVIIEYEIDEVLLQRRGFYLANVSYADRNGKNPKLELVKKLITTTVQRYAICIEYLEVWGHFFKSYDYKDEKEIRFLFYEDKECDALPPHGKEWIFGNLGIIAPIVTFDISADNNQLPLIIKRITFCSNVREIATNMYQLKCMVDYKQIKSLGKNGIIVDKSKVGNYRSS